MAETSVGTRLGKMRSNDPAHRSTYRARSATLNSRTFSAASVAPRAAAGTTVGASSNSVASQGGGLEASPTKSLVADSEVIRSRYGSCSMVGRRRRGGVSDSARSWTGWTPRVAFGASRVERVEKSNENGAIAVDLG
jgi:hypothetical protein